MKIAFKHKNKCHTKKIKLDKKTQNKTTITTRELIITSFS